MNETAESLILEALQKVNSLNTVNNYGETLLHIAASNGYSKIVKEILKKKIFDIDHRNVFGWTPLMQAIRNGKIDCVKILIDNGANVNHATYLGMSAIGLSAAISREMFEIIYKASPSALEIAARDEVCPLSIAAMRNDKDLFFRLLELGLDVSKGNTFAHCMMKSSKIPKISALAKSPKDVESYWNDCSDNIEISHDSNNNKQIKETRKYPNLPKICIKNIDDELLEHREINGTSGHILSGEIKEHKSLISPILTYNFDGAFPPSPKPIFSKEEKKLETGIEKEMESISISETDTSTDFQSDDCVLKRCQNMRPPDLVLVNDQVDLNTTLNFVPEYSPTKSPLVPPEINDEDAVFDDTTPTQSREKTPPAFHIHDPKDAPMSFFLHSYGLSRFIPIFLEQEVDVDLFLTLNNEDLEEIGIQTESERRILLSVIDEINNTK